jgi:steroid-24-oyl-CoA synthetase
MPADADVWGDRIAVEIVGGVSYRIYEQRPRRAESLLAFADRWGARPHVIQGERVFTFADLKTASMAKARQLAELGLAAGDRVFVLGWNSPAWIVNFWGCLRLGAIPVLANGWWSKEEVADALAALTPALTLADGHGAARMPADVRCGPWDVVAGAAEPATTADAPPQADEEAPAVIIFTSGTEGRPKAVVLSHRALLAGLQMLLHITRRLPQQVDAATGETALHTGPLFHIGGVQTLLRAITVGDTLVLPHGKFDAAEAISLIERHRVMRWSAVPTMVSRVLDHPALRQRDLGSLRSLTVGGASVHAELLQRIRAGLPSVQARIPTGYGLTENGGQATAASGADTAQRPGTSGRPLPCVELSFLPRPGLPDGEILVRSPTQMTGYFGRDVSPVDADGWLHTGDLGRLDEGGQLWITGRCKDLIIRGGENIAPVAVERALMGIAGVADVAVIGAPHRDLGEEVVAFVVVDRDFTPEQLAAELRGHVSSFAVPSRWRLQREPLPTNHAGKIDKAALSAEVRQEWPEQSVKA